MSAQSTWRRFQFFDKGWSGAGKVTKPLAEILRTNGSSPEPDVRPDACAYLPPRQRVGGSFVPGQAELPGNLFFGDDKGIVHVVDEECQLLFSFRAFHGAIHSLRVATDEADGDTAAAPPPLLAGTATGPFLVVLGNAGGGGDHGRGGGGEVEEEAMAVKIFRIEEILVGGFGDTTPASLRELSVPLPQTLRPPSSSLSSSPSSPSSSSASSAITAFACAGACAQVAVGFSNGAVALFRGHLTALPAHSLGGAPTASSSARGGKPPAAAMPPLALVPPDPYGSKPADTQPQQASSSSAPPFAAVSCLVFGKRALARGNPAPRLFVVTHGLGGASRDGRGSGVICCYDVSAQTLGAITQHGVGGGAALPCVVLDDEEGCAPNCFAHDPAEHQVVAGRDDAVYSFTSEDRAGAAGFEGRKHALARLTGAESSSPHASAHRGGAARGGGGSSAETGPGFVVVASHNDKSSRTEVNVYDLANKFVAFNHRLDPKQVVAKLLTGGGTAYALTVTGSYGRGGHGGHGGGGLGLMRLRERSTASKLEVLFKMNYYSHGILLAKQAGYPEAEVNKMYLLFGDHKYRKCDWEGAVEQYCHTIGFTQPSHVIRKFLDAQRIGNLTVYLERLHTEDGGLHATSDHTTLLLNCYTKLKDGDKLSAFLQSQTVNKNFDVETAVNVLRTAGFASHALALAQSRPHPSQHEWCLQILLFDDDTDSGSTNNKMAAAAGGGGASPPATSSLPGGEGAGGGGGGGGAARALAHLRTLDPEVVEALVLEYGKALVGRAPPGAAALLTELCTGEYTPIPKTPPAGVTTASSGEETAGGRGGEKGAAATSGGGGSGGVGGGGGGSGGGGSYVVRAESVLHLFVDHPLQLKRFLESVVKNQASNQKSPVSSVVGDTLLELLLQEWAAARAKLRQVKLGTAPASSTTTAATAGGGVGSIDDPLGSSGVAASGSSPSPSLSAVAAEVKEAGSAVMSLLRLCEGMSATASSTVLDRHRALVQVQVHDFKEGQHFLLEKISNNQEGPPAPSAAMSVASASAAAGGSGGGGGGRDGGSSGGGGGDENLTELLVEGHFLAGELEEVIRVCRRQSNAEARPNPNLWAKVLGHLVARCELVDDSDEYAAAAFRHSTTTHDTGGCSTGGDGGGVGGVEVGSLSTNAAMRLCGDEDELEDAYDLLGDFLKEIDRDKILPPFQVMQILSSNEKLPLSVVSSFLAKFLGDSLSSISESQRQIRHLQKRTRQVTSTSTATAHSGNAESSSSSSSSSSSANGGENSFRGGGAGGCDPSLGGGGRGANSSSSSSSANDVNAYSEAHKWEEMKRSMSKGAADNEARFAELQGSRDGFGTIAKFFGEGMIR